MDSWFKLTYHRKLFLWLLGYSLVLAGCFIGFQYHREKHFKAEELNARLQQINLTILKDLENGVEVSKVLGAQSHPFDDLRVSVIEKSGTVVFDNSLDSLPTANHLERAEIAEAISHGSGYAERRHSESTGNTYFYAATLGKGGYIVRSAVPYSVSLSEFLKADYGFLWVMGSIALAMCLLGFFATRRLGLNIQKLNRFAEKAEKGERIYDTAPFPKDELGSISNHIVRLYANLQNAISERDKEHEAALNGQREKERIKKQLTNNINHELKTPVASIQACLETIKSHKDMADEKRGEFIDRCLDNTDRLKNLLNDVSMITRMDDAPQTISKERLNLTGLIAEVVEDCQPIAASKGIMIKNNVTQTIEIDGNRSLLMSVFRNLIDNAIAYSGCSKIILDIITINHDKVLLYVADNGCGVGNEHLSRIFERFYRIDKGRSRALGGTGLGLSIVKNAIFLHSGTITAENQNEGGLRFTITLPIL